MVTARESTWQVQSGIDLEGHIDAVLYVAFSFDGSSILSCSEDGTARVWDASTGEAKTVFAEHKGRVTAAAFSPDGLLVTSANCGEDEIAIYTWDVSTGLAIRRASRDDYIRCLAYSTDGARIIVCSDLTISFIDVANHQLLRVVPLSSLSHTDCTGGWKISAAGSRLCLFPKEYEPQRLVKIWDICDKTELVHRADIGPMCGNSGFAFSADGQRAAFMNDRGVLTMVEFPQDGDVCSSTFPSLGIHSLDYRVSAISSSARTSVALHSFSDIVLVDLSSEPPTLITWERGRSHIDCIASSPDGAQVVSGSFDGMINIWNTESGRPYPSSSSSRPSSSRAGVNGTYLSRDGLQVISVGDSSLIEIHSTAHGSLATSFDLWHTESKRDSRFICLTSSPDSLRLAFSYHESRCLHIWDLQSGSIIASPHTIPRYPAFPIWSCDGSRCAVVVKGDRIHVLNGYNGSVQADLRFPDVLEPGHSIYFVYAEFSSNGRHLLLIFEETPHGYCTDMKTPGFAQHTHLWTTDTWSLDSVAISHDVRSRRFRETDEMYEMYEDGVSAFALTGTHLVIYSRQEKCCTFAIFMTRGALVILSARATMRKSRRLLGRGTALRSRWETMTRC
jgi:WD40 repeat protein